MGLLLNKKIKMPVDFQIQKFQERLLSSN